MRTNTLSLLAGSVFLASALVATAAQSPSADLRTLTPTSGLIFEPNLGQAPGDAAFVAKGRQHSVSLKPDLMTMRFAQGEGRDPVQVDMAVVNANPAAKGTGQDPLPSKTNYYIGSDPANWRTGVPHFKGVKFSSVYKGIDVVYHPAEGDAGANELEYDFIVAPGIDPDVIQLRFSGQEQISVDRQGDLVLQTEAGTLRHGRPVVYQQIAGVRHEVAGRYRLGERGTLGFTLGKYDDTHPLVIDPTVRDAQHVGGQNNEIITDIAVCDGQNLVVMTGQTDSPIFLGGEGASNGGAIFIAFFNNDSLAGTPLTLANLGIIDGNGTDQANAIAVDSHCNVFGIGVSNSRDVPVTEGPGNAGDIDALTFVVDPEANLLFSRRTGGDGADNGLSIDLHELVGANDEKLVMLAQAGTTSSTNLEVPEGNGYSGGSDVFSRISVFGHQGEAITEQASTTSYHGGSGDDTDARIRLLRALRNRENDSTVDIAFVLGLSTDSDDVWPPENVLEGPFGGNDAALGIYQGLEWSDGKPVTLDDVTYIGGAGNEFLSNIEVRRALALAFDVSFIDAALAGEGIENEGYNPVRHGPGGGQDIYSVRYSYDPLEAMQLLDEAGWMLGGDEADAATGCGLDPNDCTVCAGLSLSKDTYPITGGAPFPEFSGTVAGTVTRVCDDQLDFSTWVPGAGDVLLTSVAVDDLGQMYAAGFTTEGFPITPNSAPYAGPGDGAFIAMQAPFITNEGLVNGASFTQALLDSLPFELGEEKGDESDAPSGLSPQEIVTGFGVFIGPEQSVGFQTDSAGNAFLNLGGTEVQTNGNRSTMISASKLQTSFVLDVDPPVDLLREAPSAAKGGASETVTIQFAVDGDPSNTVTIPLVPSNPGLFALDSSGTGQGAILNPDFSVNGPDNPSSSFVIAYGTGGGDVEPDCPAATLAPGVEPLPRLQLPQRILVDGVEANFNYAGSAPGLICGVNQWNIIPTNNPSGPAVPIQVCSGDACSNIVTAAFE